MADILYLAHRIPYPPDRGDKIRSWNMLRHLATLGRVHLACFADDEGDAAHLPALREALGGALGEAHVEVRRLGKASAGARALLDGRSILLTLFDSPRLRSFVEAMLARPEVETVFAFSVQMAQFVPERLGQRFVMDFCDVDSAKFAEYAAAGGPLAVLHRREAQKLLAFERGVAERADASLFVSAAEAALFRGHGGAGNIRPVQNGVDLAYFDPNASFEPVATPRPLIVFTGQMDYAPNVDAVGWFAREVLPGLPGATFAIVGRNPTPEVRRLALLPRMIVTGAVPDVRSWLAGANVVAAPLRIARGVQNKVLEAMAMARPVVASPAALKGIEAEPGRELLVAESAEAQAAAISGLLADPAGARTMGEAARKGMETRYRWEACLAPLADLIHRPARRAAA
jgi:sugar transferase (PEP-CTERM/EpsH1 system associated)